MIEKHDDYIDQILCDGKELAQLITNEKFKKKYDKVHNDIEKMEHMLDDIVDSYEELLWISQIEAFKIGMKCAVEIMTDKEAGEEIISKLNIFAEQYSKK